MGVNIQTIKEIRFYLSRELNGIYPTEEISALSNIIIKTVLGISKLHHLYNSDRTVSDQQAKKITAICNELKAGKPIQYILGETVFYNCRIKLNNSVLIPRQETEELVDLVIRENKGFHGNILDLGTGSGCIAVALGANLPGSFITGVDISGDAIAIARENAILNHVEVSFIKGDIFRFDTDAVNKADIIVSNPPYVRDSEKEFMSNNVLDFEPHSALFVSDSDPLAYYKSIIDIADKVLLPEGRIYMEINEAMGKPIVVLLESADYSAIQIIPDINSRDRIIKGKKHG